MLRIVIKRLAVAVGLILGVGVANAGWFGQPDEKPLHAAIAFDGEAANLSTGAKDGVQLVLATKDDKDFRLLGGFAGVRQMGEFTATGGPKACPSGLTAVTCFHFEGKISLGQDRNGLPAEPRAVFILELRVGEGKAEGDFRIQANPKAFQTGKMTLAKKLDELPAGLALARRLHRFQERDAALAVYPQLLWDYAEQQADIRWQRAQWLYSVDGKGEDIPDLQQVVDMKPDFAEAWYRLGWSLLLQGRYEDSAKASRRALERKPGDWSATANLAHSYLLREDKDTARRIYLEALFLISDQGTLKEALGDFDIFIARKWQVPLVQDAKAWLNASWGRRDLVRLEAWRAQAKAAGQEIGKPFRDCPECPDMMFVPEGAFSMGGNDGELNEKPAHRVVVPAFAIGMTEVTQKQWRTVMGRDPRRLKFKECDDCPVEGVTWDDALTFLKKLSDLAGKEYRLPTEAEWEYACRAGGRSKFCGGDDLNSLGWYGANSLDKTHPVAGKKPNAWGLHDMSGNVWEWVFDVWHKDYEGAPTDGSAWPGERDSGRVLRGGSWNYGAGVARAASRYGIGTTDLGNGFRPARSLP